MRIEEINNGSYIKVPSQLESDIVKVMNRFFVSDAKELENSREGIILEVQKRIRPMVTNMVKRIAWLEGEAIFEAQMKTILEEEVAKMMADVMNIVLKMRTDILKHQTFEFPITTTTSEFVIPSSITLKSGKDILDVYVNGMKQTLGHAYTNVVDSKNIIKLVKFIDPVDNGDHVTLECWAYSETTP